MDILEIILNVLFVLGSILLIAIVLMQEGKGGGLGNAFGGAGGEAFGHSVGGINRFTAWIAGVLMLVALSIALISNTGA
ncbi:MAG: preprotein translocase subunit SecG [Planctomycetes bacterium]|nr:preprotein translocase subunit SecG [Planctomycetota bacterium]